MRWKLSNFQIFKILSDGIYLAANVGKLETKKILYLNKCRVYRKSKQKIETTLKKSVCDRVYSFAGSVNS